MDYSRSLIQSPYPRYCSARPSLEASCSDSLVRRDFSSEGRAGVSRLLTAELEVGGLREGPLRSVLGLGGKVLHRRRDVVVQQFRLAACQRCKGANTITQILTPWRRSSLCQTQT